VTAGDAPPAWSHDAGIERAWRVVSAHLTATPLVASPALRDGVFLKLETWQPTGP